MRRAAIVLFTIAFARALAFASARVAAQTGPGKSVTLRDLNRRALTPFAPTGAATVVFFVATDCLVSNSYAPEIQRVCRDYGPRGVDCSLMYEDVDLSPSAEHLDQDVRRHLHEYGYEGVTAVVDRERTAATYARASITPQAVVIDR